MTGALFVIAINIMIATTIAVASFAAGYFDTQNRSANWFGVAFLLGILSLVGEYVLHARLSDAGARLFIAITMMAALLTLSHAIGLRYRFPVRWPLLALFALIGTGLYVLILDWPRNDPARLFLYQAPLGTAVLISIGVVWRSGQRGPLDWALMVTLALLAINFFAKPWLAGLTGGVGAAPEDYATTLYALVSQSSSSITTLPVVLICLTLIVLDSAKTLIRRAETDSATGLLNQAGFERHASALITNRPPDENIALVLMSVAKPAYDRINAPNLQDALARILGKTAIIARLSSHEFTAALPQTDLFEARNRAELLRSSIAAGLVPALAEAKATIGIAEREQGDSLSDMMLRAQWAHGEAVEAGGDCVRLATRAAFTPRQNPVL